MLVYYRIYVLDVILIRQWAEKDLSRMRGVAHTHGILHFASLIQNDKKTANEQVMY